MTILVRRFDAGTARPSHLADYHELILATGRVDRPDERPQSFAAAVGRLAAPPTGGGSTRRWAADRDDVLVGFAQVTFPDDGNEHLAFAQIRVHPDHRRSGIGTALLRAMLPVIAERGRTIVAGLGVTDGGAGAHWADALGFRTVHHDIVQVLNLRTVERNLWSVPADPRYRLAGWTGTAPEELLPSLTVARDAIGDRPTGESHVRAPRWSPGRIRADEDAMREGGVEQHLVAAVDAPSGDVVAYTEVVLMPGRPTEALQRETAVVPEHRGHGLGRRVKAGMLRHLAADRPAVERVLTSTASSNTHMIDVNHAVGFETVRRMIEVEAATGTLTRRLG